MSTTAAEPTDLPSAESSSGADHLVVFTAANVFFGLKAGLTFSTSIPAAVISMAVLRGFKGMTIQENNIVQTVASPRERSHPSSSSCPASYRGLVDRLSLLDLRVDLRAGRRPRRAVLDSAAARAGDAL